MTNTTEALKMAMDELYTWIGDEVDLNPAWKACKEALESQEQEPVAWKGLTDSERLNIIKELSGWDNDASNLDVAVFIEKELKEKNSRHAPSQEQEPVAWMHRHEGEVLEFNDFKSCDKCEPLYTHPAQPLSDDEIKQLWLKLPQFPSHIDVTRAIEQAHGIGVKE